MDDDLKFHQTWHLYQLPSFYQQFLFIFYSVYKNKPRGVTVRDLIKFIKRNYYLDGDLCHQMVTALRQALDDGVIEERYEKYHLVGPIASVQNTVPNSPERKTELKNISGVFNYNCTQRKPRSRSKRIEGNTEVLERQSNNHSHGSGKINSATAKRKSGSREKCSSVGLALQEKNITDALQPKLPGNNSIANSSRHAPNITVFSKIRQYFETTVCKCQTRTSSKTKSKTKSSWSKPSSNNSSLSMKTATQNSNPSKEISLKSHHKNSTDEYLSLPSNSAKLHQCKSHSKNSKSPKLKDSSQGLSLQATRSKTPTHTLPPSEKPSHIRSSASKYSNGNQNNNSVLSFAPMISRFQNFLGCKDCSNTEQRTISPSTKLGLTASKKAFRKGCLSRKKQYDVKRPAVRFRTMGRNKCTGQFCCKRSCRICKPCKVRISRPSTVTSSRPFSGKTYTATRTSMRTRSSVRGRRLSGMSSNAGRSNPSLKSIRTTKSRRRKRKKTASSFKMPRYKRRRLESADSSMGESYWGDFCCT